jgi:hypothetical protein
LWDIHRLNPLARIERAQTAVVPPLALLLGFVIKGAHARRQVARD